MLGSLSRLKMQVHADTAASPDRHAAEFELALLNLAINARDAMPSGGKLAIAARNARVLPARPLHGDFVVIEVSDTGTGMTPTRSTRSSNRSSRPSPWARAPGWG